MMRDANLRKKKLESNEKKHKRTKSKSSKKKQTGNRPVFYASDLVSPATETTSTPGSANCPYLSGAMTARVENIAPNTLNFDLVSAGTFDLTSP